jgi:hypothetical protein
MMCIEDYEQRNVDVDRWAMDFEARRSGGKQVTDLHPVASHLQ